LPLVVINTPTSLRSVDGPCFNVMVTGELSPVDHVTTVGVPAWTEVGTLVKATFWARADTTKVRPRTIDFEKSIFV